MDVTTYRVIEINSNIIIIIDMTKLIHRLGNYLNSQRLYSLLIRYSIINFNTIFVLTIHFFISRRDATAPIIHIHEHMIIIILSIEIN